MKKKIAKLLNVYTDMHNASYIKDALETLGYDVTYVEDSCRELPIIWNSMELDKQENKKDSKYLDVDFEKYEWGIALLDIKEAPNELPSNLYYVTIMVEEEEEWPEESQRGEKANYEIMVGLNDKDSHKQEISTDDAIEIVGTLFGSCTIQQCIGFYNTEKETSLRVTVYGQYYQEMKCTCQEVRRRLNQECVILTNIKEQESTFIYAE